MKWMKAICNLRTILNREFTFEQGEKVWMMSKNNQKMPPNRRRSIRNVFRMKSTGDMKTVLNKRSEYDVKSQLIRGEGEMMKSNWLDARPFRIWAESNPRKDPF
jgi:hypothetical protein